MGFNLKTTLFSILVLSLPPVSSAESWVEFHHEKWSQKSGNLNKKLSFSNRYYYDAESLVRIPSGDVTLWIKEVSDNDRYYVKKGSPQSETVFRPVHLWCKLRKYEIMQAGGVDEEPNELMSEEVKPGSYYEKLYNAVCEKRGGRPG